MKIVHVDDNFMPTIGFQTNFLAKYAVQHGHSVVIVASDSIKYWTNSGFFSAEVVNHLAQYDEEFHQKYGAKIIRVKSRGRFLNREWLSREVFSIVREQKPDVVLVHYCDAMTGIRFAMKAHKLPYPILSDCHMVEAAAEQRAEFRNLFHTFYKRFITPYFKRNEIPVIAVVQDVKNYCINKYGMTEDMLPVMPLAADTMLFRPDFDTRKKFRQEHGISENDFVCIYTGKIQPTKKVHMLAEAFQLPFGEGRKAVLVLVGSGTGEYYDRVQSIVSQSENTIISFPTQDVEELAKFYQAADVAIWPGACSLSFFDAQACGLPVIAERISANEERISREYGNGDLYTPGEERELRALIEKYYRADKESVSLAGQRGRDIVLKKYDYNNVAYDVETLMANTAEKWRKRKESYKA